MQERYTGRTASNVLFKNNVDFSFYSGLKQMLFKNSCQTKVRSPLVYSCFIVRHRPLIQVNCVRVLFSFKGSYDCECAPGYHDQGNGNCVPVSPSNCTETCLQNAVCLDTGKCGCKAGKK